MKVLELLRAHVVKIPPTATVREMVDLFDLYQVLLLPVVDEDDQLLGVVFEQQVADPLAAVALSGKDPDSRKAEIWELSARTSGELMVAPPPFVDEHDDALQALERMDDSGRSRLPVTSRGVVTGSISRVDICQALLSDEA
jgi:predicted transcriptional regulator